MAHREKITKPHVKDGPSHTLPLCKSHQCPVVKDLPGMHLRSNMVGAALCYGDTLHHEALGNVSESGYQERLALGVESALVDLGEAPKKCIGAVRK